MTFDEKLARAMEIIKIEKLAFKSLISHMVSEKLILAEAQTMSLEDTDSSQKAARELASEVAPLASLVDVKHWSVGMTTKPGDIVLDPLEQHKYLYTGTSEMTHDNPMFYPGASGVYYWAIIPDTKDLVKIYPDVDGIIVAVKQGEAWWNVDQTQIFKWKGADNAACVWPPVEGNEWELVQPEAE